MLASILERSGVPLGRVIGEAIEYFRGCQQPDGSIADDPTSALFREWDSVNEAYSAFCLKNSSPRTAEMVVANVL
jgi:hypothetical protein